MHCRAKIFVIAASLALAFSLRTAAQISPNPTVPRGSVCVSTSLIPSRVS
jgi:hypothetical protein